MAAFLPEASTFAKIFRQKVSPAHTPSRLHLEKFGFTWTNPTTQRNINHLPLHHPTISNTAKMGGVNVRDVPADKFIEAYAAFLKRQGKLPIPGP